MSENQYFTLTFNVNELSEGKIEFPNIGMYIALSMQTNGTLAFIWAESGNSFDPDAVWDSFSFSSDEDSRQRYCEIVDCLMLCGYNDELAAGQVEVRDPDSGYVETTFVIQPLPEGGRYVITPNTANAVDLVLSQNQVAGLVELMTLMYTYFWPSSQYD